MQQRGKRHACRTRAAKLVASNQLAQAIPVTTHNPGSCICGQTDAAHITVACNRPCASHTFHNTIINDVTSPGLKERDSIELVSPNAQVGGAYGKLLGWRRVFDEDHTRSNYLTYPARSKGTNTFGPIGPWIVTADDIADPNNLSVNSFDGEDPAFVDSTANLTFSVQRVIAHASAYMTLVPGDIIHCGTSMRAAEGGKHRGLTDWDLQHVNGRPMRIQIDGIGELSNPIENLES